VSTFRVSCRKEFDGWTAIAKHGSDRSYVYCGSYVFFLFSNSITPSFGKSFRYPMFLQNQAFSLNVDLFSGSLKFTSPCKPLIVELIDLYA
jgi:hypothetical protein